MVLTPKEHHVAPAIAALEAGRVCVPGHNYIHAPASRRAKRHLDEGRLGKVSSMWMIYNFQFGDVWGRAFGGVVREICIHHAYSVLHFLGRPTPLSAASPNAHFETVEAEDQVMIVCELPSGALANLWCSVAANDFTSDPWTKSTRNLGTEGGFNHTWNESRFAHDTLGYGMTTYLDSFFYEVEHFVDRCVVGGAAPRSRSTMASRAGSTRKR